MVDETACSALLNRGASLLAVGVHAVGGEFRKGDVVEIRCGGRPVGRGVVNYSSEDLKRIAGKKSAEIESIIGKARQVVDREKLVLD